MSKLLKLKEWLTVTDAARHLSIFFEKQISEAEVLRLALDGHLRLSVRFISEAYACVGKIIKTPERISREALDNPNVVQMKVYEVLEHDGMIQTIDGIWDLTMRGGEKDYVEREWQRLTGGPEVTRNAGKPVYLNKDNGTACILHNYVGDEEPHPWKDAPSDYLPAISFPQGAHLVVRINALQKLETNLSAAAAPKDTKVGKRERETLLVIIAALAKLAKLDLKKPSATAKAIESQIYLLGAKEPKARTIENHLNKAAEILGERS